MNFIKQNNNHQHGQHSGRVFLSVKTNNTIKQLALLTSLAVTSQLTFAKPVTVTALALNDTPKHIDKTILPYASPNAVKGGTLTRHVIGSFDTFNNLIDKGKKSAGLYYVYESLMQQSLDEASSLYPLLAEKVTHDPEDASWVTYHLNPKARFADGSEVTAEDVIFTFDKVRTEGAMFFRNYYSGIKDIKALDKYRVKFTFKKKSNPELKTLVGQMSVISKAYFSKYPFAEASLRKPLGSGAYVIKDFKQGRYVELTRNPNYWGKDLLINKGAYNFDTLRYNYYRSGDVAFEAFKAGEYNFRQESNARDWAVNYNFPALKEGKIVKELITIARPTPMQAFVFNNRNDKFADIRVRKAINLAYDFEFINKNMFYGAYQRLDSFFQNSELEAKGKPSQSELALLQPLFKHLTPSQKQAIENGSVDDTRAIREKLLQARELLLKSGLTYKKHHGKQVLHTKDGKPFVIEILSNSSANEKTTLPFVRNLERLGFVASIRLVDMPQYMKRVGSFDFDMTLNTYWQGLSPGKGQFDYWHSKSANQANTRNIAGVSNKAVDIAVEKLSQANNRDELVTRVKVLDRLLRSGHYMVPTYGKATTDVAYASDLKHPTTLPLYDIGLNYWWIQPSK